MGFFGRVPLVAMRSGLVRDIFLRRLALFRLDWAKDPLDWAKDAAVLDALTAVSLLLASCHRIVAVNRELQSKTTKQEQKKQRPFQVFRVFCDEIPNDETL